MANDVNYGLAASVWTRDIARGEAIAGRLESGAVCVNDAQLNYLALELPMGGWKASGLGSRHGAGGIRKYTRQQSILVTPGYAPARDPHHFPYSAEASAAIVDRRWAGEGTLVLACVGFALLGVARHINQC